MFEHYCYSSKHIVCKYVAAHKPFHSPDITTVFVHPTARKAYTLVKVGDNVQQRYKSMEQGQRINT